MSVTMDLGKVGVLYKGIHDSTQTYERNDIVMSNGSGYIAKQNVPVGIDISNSSYWGTIVVGADSNVFATKAYTASIYATIDDVSALQAAVSSPLVANAVADMTDTEKVYVYTGSETGYTSGNWYYYNGSAWVSGGTYNSQGIGDGSITTAKLANGAVTDAKLAQSGGVLEEVRALNGYMNNTYSIPWMTGYYNSSGTYVSNANQLTTDMFRVPTGAQLTLVNPLYGCYLKEFKKEGSTYTRLRNVGGNSQHSTTISDTNPDYFYVAGLYNTSAVDIANSGTLTLTSPIGSLYEQVDYNTYNSCHLPSDGSYKTVFKNGLYNSSGVYSNSTTQICTNMLQFPKGTALTFSTTSNDIGVYIQEFAKNGGSYTRLRNLGGNSYRTISTVAQSNDYYYVFTCVRSTGLTPSDVNLLSIIAKANTNGLDVSLASNEMTINTGAAKYVFKRVTDNSINVDTWRLYSGLLTAGDFTMWSNSDAEGAIKISGESDFVSGYHGDEIMVSAECYADGKSVDLTGAYHEYVKNLTIYVTSNVYHDGGGSVAFVRHKKLVFEGNKVKISNCYIPQSNLSIESARLALFQCYKASGGTAVFTNYSVNTDFMNYAVADIASSRPSASDKMTEATLNTIYGNIVFKSLMTSGQNYKGMVSDFSDQGRVKFYFDTITSTTSVSANENIMSEFEFAIS